MTVNLRPINMHEEAIQIILTNNNQHSAAEAALLAALQVKLMPLLMGSRAEPAAAALGPTLLLPAMCQDPLVTKPGKNTYNFLIFHP